MIDFHSHSFFSDGELGPSELVRRAEDAGYKAIGITDHGDSSNIDIIIPNIVKACKEINGEWKIRALPGIELTHVPPRLIPDMVEKARALGASLVVVHGETITEPVCPGTNRAAIDAGADILAHPGLISEEDMELAAENSVYIEISGRKGHSLTNGHVANLARKAKAKMVINSDTHGPGDLLSADFARKVALGAGLTEAEYNQAIKNSEELLKKLAS